LKIVLTIALVVALIPPSNAQPVSVAPWLTGQRLVDLLQRPPGVRNKLQLRPADYLNEQTVESYIDGVHDATEGRDWCYSRTSTPGPDDLHGEVIADLRSLPASQLKRSAASLIAEALRKRYPCSPSPRSKP
jgi:hypothetical protein